MRTVARILLVAALAAAPALAAPVAASAATSSFRGVNWADARDNYVDGWVIPTGLTASDSYATVKSKADGILSGFQSLVGANTVRLPINPPVVETSIYGEHGLLMLSGRGTSSADCYRALLDDLLTMIATGITQHACDVRRGVHLQRVIEAAYGLYFKVARVFVKIGRFAKDVVLGDFHMRIHVALRSLPALEAVRISEAARMIAFWIRE